MIGPQQPYCNAYNILPSGADITNECTLGILNVVGHRQAATAIRTTFRGGPKSQKPMDDRQEPFCGENKID